MELLLTFLLFTAIALVVVGIWFWFTDQRSGANEHAGEPLGADLMRAADIATLSSANGQAGDSAWTRLSLWVAQSGQEVSPTLLVLGSAALAIAPFALLLFVMAKWWFALPALVLGAVPWVVIAIVRQNRCNRLREQLPDALDLMSRMLKAGQTIPQALRGVADEFDAPIAEEFGYCYDQQNLGLSTDAAMQAMARRTGVLELRILVVAVTVHRHTGGNLAELLSNLANVIRDRHRIQGQIRALTADGRMQAAILLALPLFLLVVLSVLNRDYVNVLFQLPWLLVGMFVFEVIGAIWLHRIVSFDF
jgi:tight adherence protein B